MPAESPSELARTVIGAFFTVYNRLGYGFLEMHYAAALERELRKLGVPVLREYAVQVYYDGEEIGFHRLDMVVHGALVVEIKAGPVLVASARRQLYNYLRATNLGAGLLLYFGPLPRFQKVFLIQAAG